MADSRRRTLAASGSSSSLIPSSIPRPRHSLAPQRHTQQQPNPSARPSSSSNFQLGESQSSSQGGGSQLFSQGHGGLPTTSNLLQRDPPATTGRNNLYHSNTGLGTMSVNRPGTTLRGSSSNNINLDYPASERRSSTYRRSTILPSATPLSHSTLTGPRNPSLKDPRDNKPLETRKRYASSIVSFLTARSFPGVGPNLLPINEKQLLQPTGVQFATVFKFLISCFDSSWGLNSHKWGAQIKKWEDEVPMVLNTVVNYPFANSITKSHLQSVGSQQSWPNMLAMLHWIVEAVELREAVFNNAFPLHVPDPEELLSSNQEVSLHEVTFASWFDMISESYPLFLASSEDEDFDGGDELERFYLRLDQGRQELKRRVEELQMEGDQLEREWNELTATPDPVIAFEQDLKRGEGDRAKLIQLLKDSDKKLVTRREEKVQLEAKREALIKERARLESLITSLNTQISSQGMTPTEIQHLSTEKLQLSSAQSALHKKQALKLESTMSLEISLQKHLNKASTLCNDYSSKAENLGILPTSPEGFEHVNFEQEVNGAQEVPVGDCTTVIKPALIELRQKTRMNVGEVQKEDVEVEERMTRKKEELEELKEVGEREEIELETAVREMAVFAEDANAEMNRDNNDINQLKAQVNTIQSTLGQNLVIAEARLSQRLAERTQAEEDTERVRREHTEALEVALEDIIGYKAHMIDQSEVLLKLAAKLEEDLQAIY